VGVGRAGAWWSARKATHPCEFVDGSCAKIKGKLGGSNPPRLLFVAWPWDGWLLSGG